ncbi:MAG: pyrroline-5-carboxylate reductase [Lentisphaerae bacterium]|nr:pyrroline-5-carboxylate reductase [Lentisphaerota bacterium]
MKIGFIGGGKMAEAIIGGIVAAEAVVPMDVVVSDLSDARCAMLRDQYGVSICRDNRELVAASDVVVLAVKPQGVDEVLAEIADAVSGEHLMISIAAGKRLEGMARYLPTARWVRVMPNLPATVGEGMSVFCLGPNAVAADGLTLLMLLTSFGQALELPEDCFDAVTAVSGSGPAFFAHILDLVVQAGVELGLAPEDATLLATQTMLGTARLLLDESRTPAELVQAVCSKKGTTEAGMAVLSDSDVGAVVGATLAAAAHRSRELSE